VKEEYAWIFMHHVVMDSYDLHAVSTRAFITGATSFSSMAKSTATQLSQVNAATMPCIESEK
jgi:hypothetical protein